MSWKRRDKVLTTLGSFWHVSGLCFVQLDATLDESGVLRCAKVEAHRLYMVMSAKRIPGILVADEFLS